LRKHIGDALDAIEAAPGRPGVQEIPHRLRKPPAHPEFALRLTQQQQTASRGLIALFRTMRKVMGLRFGSMPWSCIGRGNGVRAGSPQRSTSSLALISFGRTAPASREGTRWDHVLQTLVSYRLIDPGSEWRLHRLWFERSAMGDILGEDFRLVEKNALYAASTRCWSIRRRCLIICAGAGRICSARSLTFCRTI
jgi:hypothetical protein